METPISAAIQTVVKAQIPNGNESEVVGGDAEPKKTLADLLRDEPLHSAVSIKCLYSQPQFGNLVFPDEIYVHCDHEECSGVRRHVKADEGRLKPLDVNRSRPLDRLYFFIMYRCVNCKTSFKIFGLKAEWKGEDEPSGMCTKIYQEPPFGSPIPKRLFRVIGEANREHFLQARRSIARGLGIGAYAYYRRIVENNKFQLVKAVLDVAKVTRASSDQIRRLEEAASETRFSKAIDLLRDASAIPAVLLIDGHNPLALLHDALSEGIHRLDDNTCLERARAAEVILIEIADRMEIAVTERKAVKNALSSVLNQKQAAGT
jgi:hypothetical protein